MKNLYTIGEVASLLNISTHTLRYYDKIGIVRPKHTDPHTGYRYYTYDQIHYVDRVKYMQNFGISLTDIKTALETGSISACKEILEKHLQTVNQEIFRLSLIKEDLQDYIAYFNRTNSNVFSHLPYKTHEPERYILAMPFFEGESIYGTAGCRLTAEQHNPTLKNAHFFRQNGYLLRFKDLQKGKIKPTHYYIYVKNGYQFQHPNIITIPEGDFFCINMRILSDALDLSVIKDYFSMAHPANTLVLANEHEDNFDNFMDCIYEIQIKIG